MALKTMALIGMLIIAVPSVCFAVPPSQMALTYDADKSTLHVSAKHPTDHMDRNYVRRLDIYKNDEPATSVVFTRQKMPAGIEEDIAFKAIAGDRILVEAFASEGGSTKAEMVVPEPPTEVKAIENDDP